MGFKMKGPSLYPNYRGSGAERDRVVGTPKDANSYSKLHVNRDGNPGAADGRASSSPFQMKDEDKKEKLIKQGFTPADADRMIKDGAVTGHVEVKKKKKKKKDVPVKPKPGDMEKYSDLEKYDDDNPTGKMEPPNIEHFNKKKTKKTKK